MAKYFSALLLILLVGCATKRIAIVGKEKFIDYVNDSKTDIKLDGETLKDKRFKIKIPVELQRREVKISDCFLHVLTINDKEKIALLYLPAGLGGDEEQFLNLSYLDFKNLCIKENIFNKIESVPMMPGRRFGINKLNNAFYAIYLNVKASHTVTFDYSIQSTQL